MPTPNIYFVIFRDDLGELKYLIVPSLVIMAIPALPMALLAWIIGVRVRWWTGLTGICIAWLSGAVGHMIALLVLAGMGIVYRDLVNQEPLQYHDCDAVKVMIGSLILGCCCAYATTLRFNRWVFGRGRNSGPTESAPRRKLSFSLRTLLVVQLVLFAGMSLWLAARRPNVELYNRHKREQIEALEKLQRIP
jgi:hypothetical protein